MKRKAVLIIWRDACDRDNGNWTDGNGQPGARITTVAILYRKTHDYLSVCQSFDDNDEPLYRNVFDIPRSAVIEMRELSD